PGLQMGASLPLLTPVRVEPERAPTSLPANFQKPKGRMLIYWGCGEHVGAAKVEANYAPPIGFSLGAGQDFMAGLNLAEAGPLPSGATPLRWQQPSNATGYALAMFGAPSSGQCLLPAEVAAAVPAGMVTMIGYGPEAYFAEKPKAPTWTTRVRFKT